MTEDDDPPVVVGLAAGRRELLGVEIRGRIAGTMQRLATLIGRNGLVVTQGDGEYSAQDAHAVMVVVLGPGAPVVFPIGDYQSDDFVEAEHAVGAYHSGGRWPGNAGVARDWERRRKWKADQAEAAAEALKAKPWACEWCGRRYKTRLGAERHESWCWKNPHATSPGQTKTIVDGKVVAVSYHQDQPPDT